MPTDGKGPGQPWSRDDQHYEQEFLEEEIPHSQDFTTDDGEEYNGYEEEGEPVEPASTSLRSTLTYYGSLIGLPLLFGGLTALFVLPAIANRTAWFPASAFWPIAILLIILALVQGTIIYYLGTQNGLWMLVSLVGLFVFAFVGCFTLYGPIIGIVALVLMLAICVLLARRTFHQIPDGYVAVVYVSGKYHHTLYPGLHFVPPWEKITHELSTGEKQWISPVQRVQVSRDEDLILRATISYQLLPEDAYLAVTQVSNWEHSLRELFVVELQQIGTTFSPEDFIVWPEGLTGEPVLNPQVDDFTSNARWERVNAYLYQRMVERVALWGVQINWITIRDVSIVPRGLYVVDSDPIEGATPVDPEAARETTLEQAAVLPQSATSPSVQQLKEGVLIKAYRLIQDEKITDPHTIRSIAEKFDFIAHTPELEQTMSFDPARAAHNLYEQARRNEERQRMKQYGSETQANWIIRNPTDENMMAGG
uniref:Band 7 domain-containing protein n=1 Tax=Thermosporothrix sp. COM3 TaxID=2490863 RepID=A0A455SPM5_9CHLR|nr:hypothetical protein KTC_51340 [Thermosporothrix sp. COM3]